MSETEYEAALVEARKRLRNYRGGFVSRLLDSMTPEQREQWFAKMAQLEGECGNILCGDPREFSRDKRP